MLTEFQRRKVDRSFRHFDVNADGFIDVRDGGKLAQAYINGLGPTDPFVQLAVHERVEIYYRQLARGLDADKDGRISPAEFREVFAHAIVAPADGFGRYLQPLVDVVFTCCDDDGDGRIDRREFLSLQKLLGTTEVAAEQAFRRLDSDGDGRISREEFAAAARDYYTGDDPEGPGTALFGEV
ncbi:EF-hand domain-containing protein [Phytomonospora endophytica]|uniref:Ca2+-binding EF-hand superfamily protein n=1 Tax=Phytomonospora endophytica TaxID=714109 RepID=A0A841G1G6_9ACTN|nr:EF-hand domain-containing protein [Phytomonospora endophytica]MBB6039602.1 Ca2+-binding EF-hand superfamily protein [Phytomonospora endophytica]